MIAELKSMVGLPSVSKRSDTSQFANSSSSRGQTAFASCAHELKANGSGRDMIAMVGLRSTSKRSDTSFTSSMNKNRSEALLMPGHAKASRRVDCITEGFIPEDETETEESEVEAQVLTTPELVERSCLRVLIINAVNLRDADCFGTERGNVSDPYCSCSFSGGSTSTFRTPTIDDDLNPVWNHEGTILGSSFAHDLVFEVYDDDSDDITTLMENVVNDTDDFLGVARIAVEDALKAEGPIELRLEDAGKMPNGEPRIATITVEVDGPCTAFANLPGMDKDLAVASLQEQRPDLTVREFEITKDTTCSVASSDKLFSKRGYTKNFFGAYTSDTARFKKGDKVEFYPQLFMHKGRLVGDKKKAKQYTVEKVTPSGRSFTGDDVSYVYIQEDGFKKCPRDGMQWRRFPVNPVTLRVGPIPGFQANRVCIFYDPDTGKVVPPLPRTG